MHRRTLIAALALPALCAGAWAQNYPGRAVKLVGDAAVGEAGQGTRHHRGVK